jgi:ABC-type branched-subunit amino acid transport system substrate-binding protein
LAFAAVVALGVAGCGSGNDSTLSSSGGATSTGAAPATGTSTGAASATRTPVKILVSAPEKNPVLDIPSVRAGAMAAAANINEHGGLKGHPIQIIACNTQRDPNLALSCARRGVQERVIAVAGGHDQFTSQTMPLYEAADIPVIGAANIGAPIDATSKVAYPISGGTAYSRFAAVFAFKKMGINSVMAATVDVATGVAQTVIVQRAAEAAGLKYLGTVRVPLTATDYGPYVQQLMPSVSSVYTTLGQGSDYRAEHAHAAQDVGKL